MTTIKLDLNLTKMECSGTHEQRKFNHFKVKYTSGKRVYITIYKDSLPLTNIPKLMSFEDGNVLIKVGKDIVKIGSYVTV